MINGYRYSSTDDQSEHSYFPYEFIEILKKQKAEVKALDCANHKTPSHYRRRNAPISFPVCQSHVSKLTKT